MPEHDGTHYGLIVIGILVLHQHGHAFVLVKGHLALVRLDLSRKNFQKGRLTRAVRAYDAVAVPFRELQVHVFKQFFAAVLQAYVCYL